MADGLCAPHARHLWRRSVPVRDQGERPTFERFLRYVYEQGIADRHAKVEEIFPNGMMVEVHT